LKSNRTKTPSGLIEVPTTQRSAPRKESTPRPAHRQASVPRPPRGAAAAASAASAAAAAARPRIQKSGSSKTCRCPERAWGPRGSHRPVLVVGALGASGVLAPFVRLADQAVAPSGTAVEAAKAGLGAAVDVTSATAVPGVAAVGASRDLGREAWRGADLALVELLYKSGTMVAGSPLMLRRGLVSEAAADSGTLPNNARRALNLQGAHLASRALLEAKWANPLWTIMDVPLMAKQSRSRRPLCLCFTVSRRWTHRSPSAKRGWPSSAPSTHPCRRDRWDWDGLLAGQRLADTFGPLHGTSQTHRVPRYWLLVVSGPSADMEPDDSIGGGSGGASGVGRRCCGPRTAGSDHERVRDEGGTLLFRAKSVLVRLMSWAESPQVRSGNSGDGAEATAAAEVVAGGGRGSGSVAAEVVYARRRQRTATPCPPHEIGFTYTGQWRGQGVVACGSVTADAIQATLETGLKNVQVASKSKVFDV